MLACGAILIVMMQAAGYIVLRVRNFFSAIFAFYYVIINVAARYFLD